jgi:hypothetical protein
VLRSEFRRSYDDIRNQILKSASVFFAAELDRK